MSETFYLTIGQIQDTFDEYYHSTGKEMDFPEAVQFLHAHNRHNFTHDNISFLKYMHHLDRMEFLEKIRHISLEINDSYLNLLKSETSRFTRNQIDVFMQSSFHHMKSTSHSHTDFEVIYVYSGAYDFIFEEENFLLKEGDVIILSRNSVHRITERDSDSFYMSFFINYDTLSVSFFSVLSAHNILSDYFKKMLSNQNLPNYLLIESQNLKGQYILAQDLFLEHFRYDEYSPQGSLCWLKLFFANIMRGYRSFRQYMPSSAATDFIPILDNIDRNYRSCSLGELASRFNYSESNLSMIIKQITGKTYSDLVRAKKLTEAKNYLEQTSLPVSEIAYACGYNDTDHFSKTFRREYGLSPREYRKSVRCC